MNINYHEKETVILKAPQPLDRHRLDKWLERRGFRSEDEFYHLQRKGRCEPWQTSTVMVLDVRLSGQPIYETEEDLRDGLGTSWDELQANYFLATIPRDCISSLVREVEALLTEFGLRIEYHGEVVNSVELARRLNVIADQLSKEVDEPGSETLAILIEQQYGPR